METGDGDTGKVDPATSSNFGGSDFLSPDENSPIIIEPDATIKDPLTVDSLTIKSDLINLHSLTLVERSIKLLNIVKQIVPDSEHQGRIIKTLLTILNSAHGPPVLKHLYGFGAFTYREIEIKLGVPKATIHYITNKLQFLKIVEPKTVVFPFDPSTPGPRPIVWGLIGDDGKASIDCIYRHYGLLKRDTINVVEYKHEGKLEEILDFFKERYEGQLRKVEKSWVFAYVKDFYHIEDPLERGKIVDRVYDQLQREGSP